MAQKNTKQHQATNSAWMLTGTDALWSAMMDYPREMLGFMSMRLSKDSDFFRELQTCRSWTDASVLQSRWIQETLTDYSREVAKLLNITTERVGNGRAARNLRLVA